MIWNCFLYSWIGGKQLNLKPQYADKGKGFSKTKAAWDGKNGKWDEQGMSFWNSGLEHNEPSQACLNRRKLKYGIWLCDKLHMPN